jgi:hypothetical protein
MEKGIAFVECLRKLLAKICDGSISITKQNGHVVYINFSETDVNLQDSTVRGTAKASDGASVSDEYFKLLLKYLECVKFGTVTLRIRSSQIVGVDKSEKVKL